ncbi:hypothetical protein [Streptomyces sp. NRRL S-646]|uniref:hypothetical protein n=1 Tax=Streptomyces sp. NRRL S-646 TaxID=1463917 RepID=UPI000ABE0624|nr:hypothetical protein [Streptomyces sp. NRRL S-646]
MVVRTVTAHAIGPLADVGTATWSQAAEHFTGRDLSRLTDRLDLWTALLCRS